MFPAVFPPKTSFSAHMSDIPDDSRYFPMTIVNVIWVWKPPSMKVTFLNSSVFSHCSILALLYKPSSILTTVYFPFLTLVIALHLSMTVPFYCQVQLNRGFLRITDWYLLVTWPSDILLTVLLTLLGANHNDATHFQNLKVSFPRFFFLVQPHFHLDRAN